MILLSALLLFVIFRSMVIPIQAAIMNLLTIGAALGVTVAVFQNGWFASVLGVQKGPIEAWVPVLMFAVVFGLSMDYEVFLISRVREEWMRDGDASAAVGDGIALTGRVITAAAAIMICVFLSFTLGDERTLKEFGFGLAVAVFLDALVVRCVMLPAVLELLGPTTWRLPRWLDARLPHINIEGTTARTPSEHQANLPPTPSEATSRERAPMPVGPSGFASRAGTQFRRCEPARLPAHDCHWGTPPAPINAATPAPRSSKPSRRTEPSAKPSCAKSHDVGSAFGDWRFPNRT